MKLLRNNEGAKTQRSWIGISGQEELPPRVVVSEEIERLATKAVDSAVEVHRDLGPGLLESAYEAAREEELTLRGVAFQQQLQIPVVYKGRNLELGFRADLIVGGCLLVDLKAVERLQPAHQAQGITYLKLLGQPLGLLFNFNGSLLKQGMQRVINATHARSFPS